MSDQPKKMNKPRNRSTRPSISVSGKTYDRLRLAYPSESLAALVDNMVVTALNDPTLAARLIALCQRPDVFS